VSCSGCCARREVLAWLDEAAAEKEHADGALRTAMELAPQAVSVDEVLEVVEHFGGLTAILHEATNDERAALYASIGVSAVYNPERHEVRLGVDPVASKVCRRGDTNPKYTRPLGSVAHRCMTAIVRRATPTTTPGTPPAVAEPRTVIVKCPASMRAHQIPAGVLKPAIRVTQPREWRPELHPSSEDRRHGAVTSETVAFLDTPLPDMGAAAAEAWGIHNWSPQR
jgi:hypothetical protein